MLDYPFAVVNAIVAIAALSVSAAVLWLLLRSPVGARLVAIPSDERWHAEADADVRRGRHLRRVRRGSPRRAGDGSHRVVERARRDPRGRHDRLRRGSRRRPATPEPDREARRAGHRRGRRARERAERRDRRQRHPRVGDRAPLAGRDHERLQPARQHGRARGHPRGRLVRLLRDRRPDRARERDRAGARAGARARVRAAFSPST